MKNKNILKQATVYLSGAIEAATDDGVGWRNIFKKSCQQRKIKFKKIIDPTHKGCAIQEEIGASREEMRQMKANGRFDELTERMKPIRHYDLRSVDYASFVVVYINPSVPTWGTIDEACTAERQCKPLLAIIEGGPNKAPDWLFAMMKWKEMFSSIDECVDYLEKINNGDIALDDRWVFI